MNILCIFVLNNLISCFFSIQRYFYIDSMKKYFQKLFIGKEKNK